MDIGTCIMFMCNKLWHISLGEDIMCCLYYLQGCGVLVFLWDSDSDSRIRNLGFQTPTLMVIVWRLKEDIIRTALCWVVWQCSQSAAHWCEQFLQVQQIGFVTLGPLRHV